MMKNDMREMKREEGRSDRSFRLRNISKPRHIPFRFLKIAETGTKMQDGTKIPAKATLSEEKKMDPPTGMSPLSN